MAAYAGWEWFAVYDAPSGYAPVFHGLMFAPPSFVAGLNARLRAFAAPTPPPFLLAKPSGAILSNYQGMAWYGVWKSPDGRMASATFAAWLLATGSTVTMLGTQLTMGDAATPGHTQTLFTSYPQRTIMHPVITSPGEKPWYY